jgi:putative DNA primase/helicase
MPDPDEPLGPHDQLLGMPAAMRALPQWLMWRLERYEGDKKPRKVPYYANGRKRRGEQGCAADREALVGLDAAMATLKAGRFDGIGFAFLLGDGLIGIDIDGAIDPDSGEVSQRCESIIKACGSYTEYSPSGRGVHIIVAGVSATFKNNDVGVEVFCGRQFFTCTGRRWPGAPAEVAPIQEATLRRLRATVRQGKAASADAQARPAESAQPAAQGDEHTRMESALQALSPDMAHDDWVAVGMALKDALGDAGYRLWDYWSSKGSKYPGGETTARKWASFTRSGLTAGTVIKMAKDAGWRPQRPLRARGRAAAAEEGSAVAPKPSAAPVVVAAPTDPENGPGGPAGAPAPEAADSASTPSAGSAVEGDGSASPQVVPIPIPAWRRRMVRTDNGWKDCRENVFILLTEHPALVGLVGYDEFAHRIIKLRPPPWDSKPGEWDTNDDYLLGLWITEHVRLTVRAEATLVAGVAMAANAKRYHPVLQYLSALPPWDEVERLAHWLPECLGAEESDYTRLVGTWFVMGMVRRVQLPGCQMDYMVVLEGVQGKRKSTALRTLVGNDDWFADTPIRIGDKDAMLSLAGKWLYEVGELDSFNRAEVTAVKQYVSSRIDRVREPFARRSTDRARSGVFAGSTNQSEYFKDPTGARRFWPVACNGTIEVEKLAQWRDQLYAEALWRLKHADPEVRRYYPTREETERYLVPEQEQREIGDPWYERLATWLTSSAKFGESMYEVREVESFTSHDLLTKALSVPVDRIDGARQMSTRVGIAMHKLGWVKRRDKAPPRLWRYWRPDEAAPAQAGDSRYGQVGGPTEEPVL